MLLFTTTDFLSHWSLILVTITTTNSTQSLNSFTQMHLIDALSWAHANCLLLPIFDAKFCAVILGLALGRITQHPCKCNLEIREERVANAEWTVIPGQCRKGTCGQMLLPFFPWVMALGHTSTWFLSCSPQIKQPDGHSSGQVRDASSYQLSLFPCFDAFAPHLYSLGSHLQMYYLHTSLYLILHYLGNSDSILQGSQVESLAVP